MQMSCLKMVAAACIKAGSGRVETYTHAHAFLQASSAQRWCRQQLLLYVQAPAAHWCAPSPSSDVHLCRKSQGVISTATHHHSEQTPACHCMLPSPYTPYHRVAVMHYMELAFCHLDACN